MITLVFCFCLSIMLTRLCRPAYDGQVTVAFLSFAMQIWLLMTSVCGHLPVMVMIAYVILIITILHLYESKG